MVAAYFCKHGSDTPWCERCEEVAHAREEGRRQGYSEGVETAAKVVMSHPRAGVAFIANRVLDLIAEEKKP